METTNLRTLEGQQARRAEVQARRAKREAFRARELDRLDLDELIEFRWQDAAECEGQGRLFGTTDPAEAAEAAAYCAECPVIQQCRSWAEGDRYFEGVAGGLLFKMAKKTVLVDGVIRQRDVRTATASRAIEGSVAA